MRATRTFGPSKPRCRITRGLLSTCSCAGVGGPAGIVDFGAIGTSSALIRAQCGVTPICVEPDATLQGILAARGLPWAADLDDVTAVFDVVFSAHVLEHIADDRACLKRLYGKLPDGRRPVSFPAGVSIAMDPDGRGCRPLSSLHLPRPDRQSRWRRFHHSPLSLRGFAGVRRSWHGAWRGGAMSTPSPPLARSPPTTGSCFRSLILDNLAGWLFGKTSCSTRKNRPPRSSDLARHRSFGF